ncbi:hypothetical protein V144x_01820 [Gimesia aquarii]|uniref:Uncharacterized protein n=1 Tax=Gimesia aquarii TaxID=2527964 RepID=A0A517VP02_9PLAN|nr:hypothetical protein V144x_01820 [Gimesia aquarii]
MIKQKIKLAKYVTLTDNIALLLVILLITTEYILTGLLIGSIL